MAKYRTRISPRCHLQGRPSCTIPPSAGRAGARSRSRGAPGRAPSGHGGPSPTPARPAGRPLLRAPRPGRAEPHSTGAMWQPAAPILPGPTASALTFSHQQNPHVLLHGRARCPRPGAAHIGRGGGGGAAAAWAARAPLTERGGRATAAREGPAASGGCARLRGAAAAPERAGGRRRLPRAGRDRGERWGTARSTRSTPGSQNQWRSPRSPVQPMANTTVPTSPRYREPNPAFS